MSDQGVPMKALLLAAGYATRLYPLTQTIAKPLLPVGGRPMVDWIVDRIGEVDEIDEIHVVTNAKFAPDFASWAARIEAGAPVVSHDDGTTSEDDRLGAIGDIQFVIERAGLEGDDLLVVAGDNLFDFSLAEYVAYWRERGVASALAVHDVGSRELARQFGIVAVADDARVVGFVEKPDDPPSTLAATAAYLYHREHLPTSPGTSSPGCTAASPSTRTPSRASGTTSAAPSSSSPRTTASGHGWG
jgi:glucose-1-phosphate thymidylyltransferase